MATGNNTSFATWTTLFLLITTLATAAADVSPTRFCRRATDPNACEAIIANHLEAAGMTSTTTTNVSSPVLLRQFLTAYADHMTAATSRFSKVAGSYSGHPRERMAFADCSELINLSIDQVKDAIKALAAAGTKSSRRRRVRAADAHTSLSAVLTNHVTCTDGLTSPEKSPAKRVLEDLISKARVALAILADFRDQNDDAEWKLFKRSRSTHRLRRRRQPKVGRKCPKWVRSRDRDLLRRKGKEIKADFVVSKDDDADFSTLKKAVDAVEEGREKRVVIYVKEGVYNEYVEVGPGKKNVMIVGDGANATIFTGSHNYVDNYTTFNSFTLGT
ncbi:unnamed protein product [Cuscuta campestris]|uniref:Pectinesterase inhibitor domain-containing protein n=1 Tax=Cuscuta campestris TaxID=132261 RepID=A0A484K1W2_9ASTE|nr:unnamed protein product [Cuscuta campestris]